MYKTTLWNLCFHRIQRSGYDMTKAEFINIEKMSVTNPYPYVHVLYMDDCVSFFQEFSHAFRCNCNWRLQCHRCLQTGREEYFPACAKDFSTVALIIGFNAPNVTKASPHKTFLTSNEQELGFGQLCLIHSERSDKISSKFPTDRSKLNAGSRYSTT